MQVRFFADEEQQEGQPQFMTEPVTDATSVYIGRNAAATVVGAADTLVSALAADLQQWATTWQVNLAAAITADLALGASTLFIPTGGTIVALNTADGLTLWSHQLSGSAVQARPVVIGSTLCVGSTDGTLYALDTATGDEQWRWTPDRRSSLTWSTRIPCCTSPAPVTAPAPARRFWRWMPTARETTCSPTRSRTLTRSCSPRAA